MIVYSGSVSEVNASTGNESFLLCSTFSILHYIYKYCT